MNKLASVTISILGFLLSTAGFPANIQERDPRDFDYIEYRKFNITYENIALEQTVNDIKSIIDKQIKLKFPCKVTNMDKIYYITGINGEFYTVTDHLNKPINKPKYNKINLYIYIFEGNGTIWTVKKKPEKPFEMPNDTTPLLKKPGSFKNKG